MYKNTLADAKKQQQKQQQQNTPQQQQQILSDKRKIAIPSRRWEQKKNVSWPIFFFVSWPIVTLPLKAFPANTHCPYVE